MAARVYGFLSSVFNAALRDGLVDRSPCTVRGASNAPRASAKAVASPAEVAGLLKHLPERYRVMVLVAAWSWLRSGELRNLRRRDVDAAGGTVSVHSQVQNLRGQGKVVRDVKTAAAPCGGAAARCDVRPGGTARRRRTTWPRRARVSLHRGDADLAVDVLGGVE